MNNEYTFIENIYEILKLTMNDIMIEISVNSILLKYLQIDDMLELKFIIRLLKIFMNIFWNRK